MTKMRLGRHAVEITNEDRVVFPSDGITKGDVVSYYRDIAPVMLPHLRGRPLSVQRFPNGADSEGFFQKDAPSHYPEWISTIPVRKKGGRNCQVVADRVATLVYLANNRVITIHGALSSEPDLRKPDRLVFDLDPSVDDFGLVRYGAVVVREVLEGAGLPCYLQTTGSRGLHIVTPLRRDCDFDEVGEFAHRAAEAIVAKEPDSFTIERLKVNRGDRLLIDYFRNAYAQTSVAPYSLRARPGAPVATPIEWDELDSLQDGARSFTLRDVRDRVETRGDPWKGMTRKARSLRPFVERIRAGKPFA